MRSKTICTNLAVSAASSVTSTPILLIAAGVGSSGYAGGDAAVPGEDMGFPSSGTAVLALSLNGVSLEAGDTIVLYGSNNYYVDAGSGETFTALATYTHPTTESSVLLSGVIFIDRVPLAEALQLKITNAAGGLGQVSAYLLNN